jgi:hypothetical protein
LPGPAAIVEYVPVDRDLLAEIESAGLAGIQLSKFGASPCFLRDGVEMRETKIVAWKPQPDAAPGGTVVYKGPFCEVCDESGRVFRRGERITIDAVTWKRLQAGPAAEQFLFLPSAPS